MEAYEDAYNAGISASAEQVWSDSDLPLAGDGETESALGSAWAAWWKTLPALDAEQSCFAMLAFRAGFLNEPPPWRGGLDPRFEPFFDGLGEAEWSDSDPL